MKVLTWVLQRKVSNRMPFSKSSAYDFVLFFSKYVLELRAQSDLEVRQGTNMELGASSGMARADVSGASALPPVVAGGSDQQSGEYQSLLGNIEIPEGVDPSFLAALPEDMRQEVIAEQLRLQRLRQRARAQATDTTNQAIKRKKI